MQLPGQTLALALAIASLAMLRRLSKRSSAKIGLAPGWQNIYTLQLVKNGSAPVLGRGEHVVKRLCACAEREIRELTVERYPVRHTYIYISHFRRLHD